jgi:integrase
VLALTTGMREGELLGLRWQDTDLMRGVLSARMNVQETATRYVLAETKTAYSRRTIGLIGTAIEALTQHRTQQLEDQAHMGDA